MTEPAEEELAVASERSIRLSRPSGDPGNDKDGLLDVMRQVLRGQLAALEASRASVSAQMQLLTELEARLAGLTREAVQPPASNGWPATGPAPQPSALPAELIPRQPSQPTPEAGSETTPQLAIASGSELSAADPATSADVGSPPALVVQPDATSPLSPTSNEPQETERLGTLIERNLPPSDDAKTPTVPEWQQPPMVLDDPSTPDLILQVSKQVSEGRRATLTPPLSVVGLRPHLPTGLGIQPKEDDPDLREVLFYRYQGEMAQEVYLRLGHRLVDLLSVLSSDGLLQPKVHDKLSLAIKERPLPIEPRAGEHIEARARWRRFVAVDVKQLNSLVQRSGYAFRSQLSHCLVLVTREDPRFNDQLGELLSAAQLPVPTAAWLDGTLLTRQMPAPSRPMAPAPTPAAPEPIPAYNPASKVQTFAPAPAPAHVPDLRLPPFDPGLIAAKRADTASAHKALQGLGDDADIQGLDGEELSPSVAEPEPAGLDGPVRQLADFLSRSEKHALADVRAEATALGIAPLEAVRLINEWAERHMTSLDEDFDTLVEVDDEGDAVWVEPQLKVLLR